MLKNTHMAFGLTIFLSLMLGYYFFTGDFIVPIFGLALLPILSLFPDVDHLSGFLNKRIAILRPLSKIYGHRTWSHDVLTLFVVATMLFRGLRYMTGYSDMMAWDMFAPRMGMLLEQKGIWSYMGKVRQATIQSYEFWGIYIGLLAHVMGDVLTKGPVKLFFRARLISDKFSGFLMGIPVLPLKLLVMLEDAFMGMKAPLMPKTGSDFEKKVYATLCNIFNISAILYIVIIIRQGLPVGVFETSAPYYILGMIALSTLYLLSQDFDKIKKEGLVLIQLLMMIIISFILFIVTSKLVAYLGLNMQNPLVPLSGIVVIGLIMSLWYKRYIKTSLDIFNNRANEGIYLLLAVFLISHIVYHIVQ